MSFHKNPWDFIYVFAQKLNFIIFIYLMKKLFQYLKVMSKLEESIIMGLFGGNFIFLFQSLKKKNNREFIFPVIIYIRRYIKILRVGSVFRLCLFPLFPVNWKFLMSHHRKNSMKDEVISKTWIYLERNILRRVWAISEGERSQNMIWFILWTG